MKKDLTIYDVQVNCARLSKEKIENLARIVKENGGKIFKRYVGIVMNDDIYFSHNEFSADKHFNIYEKNDDLKSISYARFVELFDKKELEVGKWYKYNIDNNNSIKFIFSGIYGSHTQTGFSVRNEWSDKLGLHKSDDCIPMTEQEVSTLLIAEAKKRLGDDWENAKIRASIDGNNVLLNKYDFDPFYNIIDDRLWNKNGIIYEKEKWAELLVEELFNVTPEEKKVIIKSVEAIDQMKTEIEKTMNTLTKPSHYRTKSGYDVIDLWQDNKLNANQGAMCKYILRAGKKLYPNMNERESYYEDMKKAFDHMSRELEFVKKELGK